MEKRVVNLIWGGALILIGIFLLLLTTNVIDIRFDASWLFGIIFLFGFIFFMGVYFSTRHEQFWPLIPGIILLGLAILVLSERIGVGGQTGAGLFMLFIGLSFLAVYVFHREHWWAIIPAGMVGSVSLVILFGNVIGVGLMFLGMGATFIALYFILAPTEERHWWPLIPGGILAFMGSLFLLFQPWEFRNFILPLALIIIGIILVINSLKKKLFQ